MSMKNSSDTIWNRTSDLPICSTAPWTLCYRGPHESTKHWLCCNQRYFQGITYVYNVPVPSVIHFLVAGTCSHFLLVRYSNLIQSLLVNAPVFWGSYNCVHLSRQRQNQLHDTSCFYVIEYWRCSRNSAVNLVFALLGTRADWLFDGMKWIWYLNSIEQHKAETNFLLLNDISAPNPLAPELFI